MVYAQMNRYDWHRGNNTMFTDDDRNILHHLSRDVARVGRRLDRIERVERRMETEDMATQETLAALTASVSANTDEVASAKMALEGYVKSVEELTKALHDAIANDDEAAIKKAADDITANNATLRSAIPAVSGAVGANT